MGLDIEGFAIDLRWGLKLLTHSKGSAKYQILLRGLVFTATSSTMKMVRLY